MAEPNSSPSSTDDPDVVLMLKIRDCNQSDPQWAKAFEGLVNNYRSRVIGILYHMLGSVEEAEDLAQEVFFRVFKSKDTYQPSAKFSTWLFTIVNNLALNAIRDKKRKPVNDFAGSESGPLGARPLEQLASAPSGALPSRIFAKYEMAEIVREAVQQLSEEQRLAVLLNKFEGMNYKQIADVLNKSEMAVKSLLSRARETLREKLEPYLASGNRPKDRK